MKQRANFILGLLLAAVIALGVLQGNQVNHLRDSDRFFNWILSAANQYRLQGSLKPQVELPDGVVSKDQELFESIEAAIEQSLPDLPDTGSADGKLPKLVQYAIAPEAKQTSEEGSELDAPDPEEEQNRLEALWEVLKSPALKQQRHDFETYLRNKQLISIGSQFDISQIYSNEDTLVSLSNIFFGFRKMAANLLWLQADKMWHKGEYYRMIPVMKTTVSLDPNFVDAYLVGAWHMSYNFTAELPDTPVELRKYDAEYGKRVGEKERLYYMGVNFLLDGIQKNPSNYKLYFDLGFAIYGQKLEDYANSVKYLSEAFRYPHDSWVERMLYRAMRLNGQYEDALAGYDDYMKKNPTFEQGPRLIAYTKAYFAEDRTKKTMKAVGDAEKAASQAQQKATDAMAAGDQAAAQQAQAAYAELNAQADALRTQADTYRTEAKTLWEEIRDQYDDPLARAKLLHIESMQLVAQKRYTEALALLDYARFESDEVFTEFSDLMIDIRQMEGSPLNASEKMAVARRHLIEAVADRKVGERLFQFRDDGWYQMEYSGQAPTMISDVSPQLSTLKQSLPGLDDILAMARLNQAYPDLKDTLDLGDRVLFKVDDTWYEYRESAKS